MTMVIPRLRLPKSESAFKVGCDFSRDQVCASDAEPVFSEDAESNGSLFPQFSQAFLDRETDVPACARRTVAMNKL